jgi:PAS domain S-box-containing protein
MKDTHFENFFNLSTELLCMIDLQGFFIMVNPAFSAVLGYKQEELAQKPYIMFIHPEDREITLQQAQKLLQGEPVQQFEVRYITKNQKVVWLSWTSSTIRDGYFYAAAKDVTSLKEAEQSLQTSEKKFRSLVQNGYEIISIIGPDGTYLYHSDSVYRLLGYRPEELIGLSAKDLVHPDDVAKVGSGMLQLQHVRYVNNGIPYRIKAADGSYKWFESTGSNMLHDPSIRGIVVNSRDITEKLLLQQELQHHTMQKEKEVAVSRIKGEQNERTRLGQELHDNINQLLTSAKLYIEFMRNDVNSREALLTKSEEILQTVIGEIRKLSHQLVLPGNGNFNLQQSIEELARSVFSASPIQFHLEICCLEKNPLLEEFKTVLYRIIQEQFTNILKHAEASKVRLTLKKDQEGLQLLIADNGKGFNPSVMRKGIGLSNITDRARIFGGIVQINTAPGQGCELLISFPNGDIEVQERLP